jgi:hypothetical protein
MGIRSHPMRAAPLGSHFAMLLQGLGMTGLVVLFGLIATTGSLLIVAIAIGSLFSIFLLMRIDLAVWMILVGAILVSGPVGLAFPETSKLPWMFSILGFFLLGAALLMRFQAEKNAVPLPGFIRALLIFMVASVAYSFFGDGSIFEILAGTKRTYQLFGFMLVIAMMPINDKSRMRFDAWLKFLYWVAFLQLPFALFQRLVLVPKRVGLGGGTVAIDIVSGTFEASLDGGGSSSILVMFLIIILAYVLSAWQQKLISFWKMLLPALILAAPLFLGETKIALVLLPMMFGMVFAEDLRKHPIKAVAGVLFGVLVAILLGWLYLSVLATGATTIEQQLQKTIDYNFGSVGYLDRYSLNRTSAIAFWFTQHGLNNPVEAVFGHGIGSSYSGTGSLVPGHLSQRYPFMAINLTGVSTLLWDTGLLGTGLMFAIFWAAWRATSKLLRIVPRGEQHAHIMGLKVSIACNAFMLLYSNSIFAGLSHETILAFSIGYVAWLTRVHATEKQLPAKPNEPTSFVPNKRIASNI